MTIENIYTVKSSFIVKEATGIRLREETDIYKAKKAEDAEIWTRNFYNSVWKDSLLDWIHCSAKPIYICDISQISIDEC